MANKKHKARKAPPTPRAKSLASAQGSKPRSTRRSYAIGAAAGLGAIAAIVVGFFGLTRRSSPSGAQHPVPDLAADAPPVG